MAGSIAFSGKAIIVKLAYRYGVDAVTLIMYRMLFALPLFALLAWWAGRGRPALTRRDWIVVTGLGFSGYYLASFLDFAGLAYITASLERLILYLNPTLVLALGAIVFKRRVRARQLIALARQLLRRAARVRPRGLAAGNERRARHRARLRQRRQLRGLPGPERRGGASASARLRLTGLATSVACLFCIAQFFVLRPLSALAVAPEVIWLSVLNATLCTFAPVLMVMMAIERVGAAVAAQTGMIGPLSTILMGIVILGEPFTGWIVAGTVLVLAGNLVAAKWR